MQNMINLEPDDAVMAYINVKNLNDEDYINNNFIVLCTTNGVIKKTSLEAYSRPRQNGVNAITVRDGDELLEARIPEILRRLEAVLHARGPSHLVEGTFTDAHTGRVIAKR